MLTCGGIRGKMLRVKGLAAPTSLSQESQAGGGEVRQIRKDSSKRRRRDSKPKADGRAVLDGNGRNPAAADIGIVGTPNWKRRECAVDLPALHCATQHQVMAAPRMITSIGCGGLEGAAEFGFGERNDVLRHAQLLCRVIERGERRAQFSVKGIERCGLIRMPIEAAPRGEEDLAAHAQIRLHLNNLRHLLQLRERASMLTS